MSEKFEKAIKVILRHEGGYARNPADPGGETNFGISKRSYPHLDIRGLTEAEAIEIYRRDFWLPIYDRIGSDIICTKIFDMAVNMGHNQAHKLVQRAVGVTDDGVFGKRTLAAVNDTEPEVVLRHIKAQAEAFYRTLVRNNARLKEFLPGWLARANWPRNSKKTEFVNQKA